MAIRVVSIMAVYFTWTLCFTLRNVVVDIVTPTEALKIVTARPFLSVIQYFKLQLKFFQPRKSNINTSMQKYVQMSSEFARVWRFLDVWYLSHFPSDGTGARNRPIIINARAVGQLRFFFQIGYSGQSFRGIFFGNPGRGMKYDMHTWFGLAHSEVQELYGAIAYEIIQHKTCWINILDRSESTCSNMVIPFRGRHRSEDFNFSQPRLAWIIQCSVNKCV